MTTGPDRILQPGDPAPEFQLPAVNREGTVSLADYRGKGAVFVALFRGLMCPFCRRQLARLNTTRDKLGHLGVETVAVVNTPVERARQYFQYRPTRVVLGADPEVRTHRAFGLAQITVVPDSSDPSEVHWPQTTTMAQLLATSFNPGGELPQPMNLFAVGEALNARDGFQPTPIDEQLHAAHGSQREGIFLIDAIGTIRWTHIEAPDNPNQLGSFPSDDEILAAARAVCG